MGVIFFGLAEGMFASPTLDALVNAAASFSAAIGQQLVFVQNEPAPAEFSEKTIAYAQAKTALREAMPELINVATGKESRPAQLDKYSAAFSIAGEKQEKAADYCCETRATARIRHPNVALVSGLGRNVQNYFYAMEFV